MSVAAYAFQRYDLIGFHRGKSARIRIYLLENYAEQPVSLVSRSTLSLLEINANEAAVGGLVTR